MLARALAGRGYGGLGPADGSRGRLLLQHCPVERVVVLVVQGAEQYPIKQLIIHTATSVKLQIINELSIIQRQNGEHLKAINVNGR